MTENSASRPERPVLKRNGFQLCGSSLTVTGIDRTEGSRLRELFDPVGSFRLKWEQKAAAADAKALFKRPFFAAQLRHYGIKFPSSSNMYELRDLLAASVREGKCDSVPESVVRLQQDMRRDHAPVYRKWEEEARAWDARLKQRDDEEFNRLATPGERAKFDLHRFMNHYFLTNGKPDPAKTPKPLALRGFGETWRIHSLAESVPGLHTKSGGSDANRTVCIGWDRGAVFRLAGEIDNEARQAKRKQRESVWEDAMDAHRRFVEQAKHLDPAPGKKKAGRPKKNPPQQAFDIERCRGSYIIQCKDVMDGWDIGPNHKLTLDISVGQDGLLIAAYDFGVIEGTMMLSLSEEKLDSLVDLESRSDSEDEDEGEYGDSYDDYGESDEEENCKPGKKTSKKTAASRKRAAAGLAKRPAKKKRMTPSLSRRVYYRLRGRETGEGEILDTPRPGHLDFLDDQGLTFEGLAYEFPYLGKNIDFRGYKVSDAPRKRPESWSAFSSEAYEHARVSRW